MSEESRKLAEKMADAFGGPAFNAEAEARRLDFIEIVKSILDRIHTLEEQCKNQAMTVIHNYPPIPPGHFATWPSPEEMRKGPTCK